MRLVAIAFAFAMAFAVAPRMARADRIDSLASTLATSKHSKARISAAIALGRTNDRRALRALVRALRDDNRVVRAVAATALGQFGDPAALPALQAATRDREALVRKRAVESISALRNGMKLQAEPQESTATATAPRSKRAGFGSSPRELSHKPNLYVVLKSARDESGVSNQEYAKLVAKKMRHLMMAELRNAPKVTTTASDANGLQKFALDASITKFARAVRGPYIEVECEIRVAISNENGKMLSFLTGGAKVQVPKHSFNHKYLPRLRLEALENAVKGLNQDVINHLRRKSPNPS